MINVIFKEQEQTPKTKVSHIPVGQPFKAIWQEKKLLFVNVLIPGQPLKTHTFSFNSWVGGQPFAIQNPVGTEFDKSYTEVELVDIEVKEI